MKNLIFSLLFISFSALANTTTYICNYPKWSDLEGVHETKEKFEISFIINRETGKTYMLGNNGSEEVMLHESSEQLVFVEITLAGNIMATTITDKLKTVHSRNSIMFGELIPSQYYGQCEVK